MPPSCLPSSLISLSASLPGRGASAELPLAVEPCPCITCHPREDGAQGLADLHPPLVPGSSRIRPCRLLQQHPRNWRRVAGLPTFPCSQVADHLGWCWKGDAASPWGSLAPQFAAPGALAALATLPVWGPEWGPSPSPAQWSPVGETSPFGRYRPGTEPPPGTRGWVQRGCTCRASAARAYIFIYLFFLGV